MDNIKEKLIKQREELEKKMQEKRNEMQKEKSHTNSFNRCQSRDCSKYRSYRSRTAPKSRFQTYEKPQFLIRAMPKYSRLNGNISKTKVNDLYEKFIKEIQNTLTTASKNRSKSWYMFSDIKAIQRKIGLLNTVDYLEKQIKEKV